MDEISSPDFWQSCSLTRLKNQAQSPPRRGERPQVRRSEGPGQERLRTGAGSACSGLRAAAAGVPGTARAHEPELPGHRGVLAAVLRAASFINCPMHSTAFILQQLIETVTHGAAYGVYVYIFLATPKHVCATQVGMSTILSKGRF